MSGMSRRSFLQTSAVAAAGSAAIGAAPGRSVNLTASDNKGFEAGVARVDITPGVDVPMWGYGGLERTSTGTLDPLYAKALVIKLGETALAIVVTDLGRMPMMESCMRIREAVQESGVDDVVFSATHTHSGPIMEELSMPHTGDIEAGIVEAIKEAASGLRPATFSLARGEVDIAHNRRVIIDGECYMRWRNAERFPSDPMDKEAGILSVLGEDGKPMAILVQYACHPVVFGPDNREFSADWAGEMCKVVGEQTGATCFFLQGGAGDINPYLDKTPLAYGGVESMRGTGREAADGVLRALRTSQPLGGTPSMAYRETPMNIGVRWNLDDPDEQALVKEAYGLVYDKYIERLAANPVMPLGVLVLNNELAYSFVPGELFVQYQLDFKHHSPLKHSFLCGYANDFWVYFPTIGGAAIGGYGGTGNAFVEIGAGDRLIAESCRLVGEITGQLAPPRTLALWQNKEWNERPQA